SKAYGAATVLDSISALVNRGERVGLVGANGSGKSTILKLITGEIEPDAGSVTIPPGVTLGYLPQVLAAAGEDGAGQTVGGLLAEAQAELRAMARRIDELAGLMGQLAGPALEPVLVEYGQLAERFEQRGGYELDHQLDLVLEGLAIAYLDRDQPVATLSGGEKTRLGLAALLLSAPDLLLLDEPTNHLDGPALGWLERHIREHRGALLAVSHDRAFLNATATAILELDEHSHRLKRYAGDYDAYLAQKRQERLDWAESYERQQAEIKQLRQRMKDAATQVGHNRPPSDGDKLGYKAAGARVQSTVARNIRAAEQLLGRILDDPIPEPPEPLRFQPRFNPQETVNQVALELSGAAVAFEGGPPLLRGVDLTVYTRSRILIVGGNGAGKSTLLNLLAGALPTDAPGVAGTRRLAPKMSVGYLAQEERPPDPELSLFEAFRAGLQGFKHEQMTLLMHYGLFAYDETDRRLGALSAGQYRKLQIARLMAERANLLLLDEPTNHISFDVLEQLEAALDAFPGPVVAVSHDRWFIERFRGDVWLLRDGRLSDSRAEIE
ncbi:MAG TPA: ABC-F family ATP-binding cassette domain-containing protein, partial [Herpetosiphonaceae bacterium]